MNHVVEGGVSHGAELLAHKIAEHSLVSVRANIPDQIQHVGGAGRDTLQTGTVNGLVFGGLGDRRAFISHLGGSRLLDFHLSGLGRGELLLFILLGHGNSFLGVLPRRRISVRSYLFACLTNYRYTRLWGA